MKKYILYAFAFITVLSITSCYTSNRYPHGHLPPGQAKKVYGGKSAKRYAPGQNKKNKGKHRKQHKHDAYYVPVHRY